MQLETIIAFISASALLTIMPGPDIIYVLMQSVTNGKKVGVLIALGLVTGIIFHTALIAFGVSSIIQKHESIYQIIKIFGALYLFYLAFKIYKSSAKLNLKNTKIEQKKLSAYFSQGLFMNILNPKVTIFFLAFFPKFINTTLPNIKQQIISLGFLFMLQAFIIFSIVAFMASKMTSFLRKNKKFEENLKITQIVVFIGIGLFILF